MLEHTLGDDGFDEADSSILVAPPIEPRLEVAAYESLWLGDGVWFKNLAQLFEQNPGALPSELVPRETIQDAWHELVRTLGEDKIRQFGVRIHGAGEYPAKLRDADHPVELLYYHGNWELAETPCVAVVGTREPSAEGVDNTRRIVRTLIRGGYTIVSGLAKGIDTAAHETALAEAGGRTIAVLGTPLFESYPRENSAIQERIAREHLLISQVPFLRYRKQHFKANSLFFPARNVTMSALTSATIIVEAGNTSGTLVQARAALAQGRKLFVLDSCFRDPRLIWPAKFEAKGAVRVTKASEILEALKDATPSHD